MPSHIFTRVGDWKESIDTNQRSMLEGRKENVIGSVLHAMDYMVYADLQLGRDTDANAVVVQAADLSISEMGSLYARAAMPARYAVERDQWAAAAALPDPIESKFPFTEALTHFARGIGAARSGSPDAAEKDAVRLAAIASALKAVKNEYWATEVEVQRLGVAAWIAFVRGKSDEALAQMRAAADMEDASEKAAVTPGRILPARELLGDMLLESGHPADALAAYEAALTNDPKRLRSFDGAARAALAAGNSDKAHDYYGRMVAMADSTSTRVELIKARTYLASK
jgi:tetratricopeptide (TPR) repeat protein